MLPEEKHFVSPSDETPTLTATKKTLTARFAKMPKMARIAIGVLGVALLSVLTYFVATNPQWFQGNFFGLQTDYTEPPSAAKVVYIPHYRAGAGDSGNFQLKMSLDQAGMDIGGFSATINMAPNGTEKLTFAPSFYTIHAPFTGFVTRNNNIITVDLFGTAPLTYTPGVPFDIVTINYTVNAGADGVVDFAITDLVVAGGTPPVEITGFETNNGQLKIVKAPEIVTTAIQPNQPINNNGVDQVTLKVQARDDDGDLETVKANLTQIGGLAEQAMAQDTTPGNEEWYLFTTIIAPSVAGGTYSLPVTATDHETLTDTDAITMTVNAVPTGDSDGDGMTDAYEDAHGCLDKLISDSSLDPDNDGLTSLEEFQYTSPHGGQHMNACANNSDTDSLTDTQEYPYTVGDARYTAEIQAIQQMNLTVNGQPVNRRVALDPTVVDSDGDGLQDGDETSGTTKGVKTFPDDADTDDDSLNDLNDPDPLNANDLNDMDGDGLPDSWEVTYWGSIEAQDGTGDPDSDGLTNLQEYQHSTNPTNPDTDADGLQDGDEVNGTTKGEATNPTDADSDDDGLNDLEDPHPNLAGDNDNLPREWEDQYNQAGVCPLDWRMTDTDGNGTGDNAEDYDNDGFNNTQEYANGTNPCVPDSDDNDNDGLVNTFEENYAQDPANPGVTMLDQNNPDSDGDGIGDADEDFDNDSLTNLEEQQNGTSPYLSDTDGDGLSDAGELDGSEQSWSQPSNPALADSDSDGLDDPDDPHPLLAGDNDQLPQSWEDQYNSPVTCPLDWRMTDTDEDGTNDDAEDYDGDGYTNLQEYANLTAPCISDTGDQDGDGLTDQWEDLYRFNPEGGALMLDKANPDTDGNGTPDGEENFDGDDFDNATEQEMGTNPYVWDANESLRVVETNVLSNTVVELVFNRRVVLPELNPEAAFSIAGGLEIEKVAVDATDPEGRVLIIVTASQEIDAAYIISIADSVKTTTDLAYNAGDINFVGVGFVPGDYNKDGLVNYLDFILFSQDYE